MKVRCMNCMAEYEEDQECCPHCGYVRGTQPKEIYHLYPEVVLAGRYVVGTVVSYGGFGVLYRAWDEKLEAMVAVKEYFPSNYVNRNPGEKEIFIYTSKKQGEFENGLKGFLEEARSTAKFSSYPNIVNVYDYFQENGTAYMVMEFMDGKTLKQYIKEQGGKIGWEKAVEVLSSICDDLQVVHEAGILHRDISPDNIMLCADGAIKLFDFGAARFSSMESEMTRTVILKMGFAPPEQYRKKSKQGPWTDVYALGATLYRAITGVLPDESVNRQEAIRKKEPDTLRQPKELEPEIPDYLNAAICRAMALEPDLRFKNVLQLKQAILNQKQYPALEKELEQRKRRRMVGIGVLAASLACAAGGCLYYYHNKQAESTLRGARVTVWAPVPEDDEPQSQESILQEMLAEFYVDYPGVSVDISCIPLKDYESRLSEAAGTDAFPTLYLADGVDPGLAADRQADLSKVLNLVEEEDYYCLGRDQLGGDLVHTIPLGMQLSVVYGNETLLGSKTSAQVRDSLAEENDRAGFFAGEAPVWLADTLDYAEVQEALPGIYEVLPVPGGLVAKYNQVWSVDGNARKLDQEAANRILYYFLGESAQDVLHLQNDSSLPLNKNILSTYMEVNQEFAFLKEELDSGEPVVFPAGPDYEKSLDEYYKDMVSDEQKMGKVLGGAD